MLLLKVRTPRLFSWVVVVVGLLHFVRRNIVYSGGGAKQSASSSSSSIAAFAAVVRSFVHRNRLERGRSGRHRCCRCCWHRKTTTGFFYGHPTTTKPGFLEGDAGCSNGGSNGGGRRSLEILPRSIANCDQQPVKAAERRRPMPECLKTLDYDDFAKTAAGFVTFV